MSFITKIGAQIWARGLQNFTTPMCAAQRNFHLLNSAATKAANSSTTLATGVLLAASPLSITQGVNRLLLTPFNSLLMQVAGFKVKGRLKRRCKDCYIVVRHQRHYVICPTHPRHKQMSMKKRDYKSWILTHATQSKERGF